MKLGQTIDEVCHISKTDIPWPSYTPLRPFKNKTLDIKLYEHILWFSQVKSIVNRICDHNNQELFNDISELNKFTEMKSPGILLTKKLNEFNSKGNFKIDIDDQNTINSTLNAHFIMKLRNDRIINKIEVLDKILNNLSLRNEIMDENEIQWIHQIVDMYHPNFNIMLPKFEPQDLFYLFVSYSGDIKILEKGPLISNINCKNLLDSIGNIIFNKPETFVKCADMIAQIIYKFVFNKDKIQINHSEYKMQFEQELHKSLASISDKNSQENEQENKTKNELMDAAIFVLDISDKLDSLTHDDVALKSYKFIYDDITFLSKGWVKDDDFIKKYPSFVYWLIKYQKCAETLQNIYSYSVFNEDNLPFWLFAVRLMSSQNCVRLDIDSSTTIGKFITEIVNQWSI